MADSVGPGALSRQASVDKENLEEGWDGKARTGFMAPTKSSLAKKDGPAGDTKPTAAPLAPHNFGGRDDAAELPRPATAPAQQAAGCETLAAARCV